MEVRFCERVNGKALFSLNKYDENEIILTFKGEIKNFPCKYSIEIGENKHILDPYGIYINHSFEPNCKILEGKMVSIKKINIGDELHFNYNENETNMACPFKIDDLVVSGKNANKDENKLN